MGKIKEDGLIKKLSNGWSIDSDIDNETYGSWMLTTSNQKWTETTSSSNAYDIHKSFIFEQKEKWPDLYLKTVYGEEDEPNYSDEELVGDEALDNYIYKWRNMYRLQEKRKELGKNKKSPLLDFLLEVDKDKKIPKSLGMVNKKFK